MTKVEFCDIIATNQNRIWIIVILKLQPIGGQMRDKQTQVEKFLETMSAKYNFSWIIGPQIEKLTLSEIGRGKKLVKTALYHIRRELAKGSTIAGSYENYMLISFFAGPEHVNELLNLQGFSAFWSNNDRSYRCRIMEVLERNVGPNDILKLEEFGQRLEEIEYDSGTDYNRYDKYDFGRVLAAAQGNCIPDNGDFAHHA